MALPDVAMRLPTERQPRLGHPALGACKERSKDSQGAAVGMPKGEAEVVVRHTIGSAGVVAPSPA